MSEVEVAENPDPADEQDVPDVQPADAFGDSDGNGLPQAARQALVTLLTHRFITREKHRDAWDGLVAHEAEIRSRLADLFLLLVVDHDHEVAFKRQSEEDGAPVLLRRDRPLSREASFLLIFLRREHAYTDAQDEAVVVTRDQVAEFLSGFAQDAGDDEVKFERTVDAAIRVLEGLQLLTREPEDPGLLRVSPAVVPLVTPEALALLEQAYVDGIRSGAVDSDDPEDAGDSREQ